VRNAIHPGPQTAAPVKIAQATPKLEMYFLKQISLLLTICFVSAGEAVDSRAERYTSRSSSHSLLKTAPSGRGSVRGSRPGTWVTVLSGDMGDS
jgi:hypothetical protein